MLLGRRACENLVRVSQCLTCERLRAEVMKYIAAILLYTRVPGSLIAGRSVLCNSRSRLEDSLE